MFKELSAINVKDYTEKKNGFNYLSWSYAWGQLQKVAPQAKYEVQEFDGLPVCYMKDGSAMVVVSVSIDDIKHKMWLAVTDYNNKAIKNPNSADIANSTMRCLVKAIAMHGLGLYIYAGEDLPEAPKVDPVSGITKKINTFTSVADLKDWWREPKTLDYIAKQGIQDKCDKLYETKINELAGDVSK